MTKINVMSLFDGISCGRVALEKANIKVNKYYASEIDKYATKVSEKNYPDIIRLGDITKWKEWDIDWGSIDLIMAGSPCQGFSFAGKQLAFDDPRSKLFFVFVDILNHVKSLNPNVKFLLENVRMKKEYQNIISNILNVEPVKINSALLSAQNRVRFYWANWEFGQPEDKGIMLKDVLEEDSEVDSRMVTNKGKSYAMTASYNGAVAWNSIERKQRTMVIVKEATKKGYTEIKIGDCADLTFPKSKTRRGRNMKEKSNCLTASNYDFCRLNENLQFRKLTPIECERLQTLEDNYTEGVSNSQRYKMLGNGWTVDIVSHILKNLTKGE